MWYVNLHSFPVSQLSFQAHIKHRKYFSWIPSKSERHSCTGLKWLQSTGPVSMSWKPHKGQKTSHSLMQNSQETQGFHWSLKNTCSYSLRTATASTKQLYQNTPIIFCLGTSVTSLHCHHMPIPCISVQTQIHFSIYLEGLSLLILHDFIQWIRICSSHLIFMKGELLFIPFSYEGTVISRL